MGNPKPGLTSEEESLARETIRDLIHCQRRIAAAVALLQILVGDDPSDYRARFYGRDDDQGPRT